MSEPLYREIGFNPWALHDVPQGMWHPIEDGPLPLICMTCGGRMTAHGDDVCECAPLISPLADT